MRRYDRPIVLGYYITPNRPHPTKGVVYDRDAVSPCMTAGMGCGGNIVPTVIERYESE